MSLLTPSALRPKRNGHPDDRDPAEKAPKLNRIDREAMRIEPLCVRKTEHSWEWIETGFPDAVKEMEDDLDEALVLQMAGVMRLLVYYDRILQPLPWMPHPRTLAGWRKRLRKRAKRVISDKRCDSVKKDARVGGEDHDQIKLSCWVEVDEDGNVIGKCSACSAKGWTNCTVGGPITEDDCGRSYLFCPSLISSVTNSQQRPPPSSLFANCFSSTCIVHHSHDRSSSSTICEGRSRSPNVSDRACPR